MHSSVYPFEFSPISLYGFYSLNLITTGHYYPELLENSKRNCLKNRCYYFCLGDKLDYAVITKSLASYSKYTASMAVSIGTLMIKNIG